MWFLVSSIKDSYSRSALCDFEIWRDACVFASSASLRES